MRGVLWILVLYAWGLVTLLVLLGVAKAFSALRRAASAGRTQSEHNPGRLRG